MWLFKIIVSKDMKHYVLIFIFAFFIPLNVYAQEDVPIMDIDAMVKEVKTFVKRKTGDDLWHSDVITNIVKKHIPLGTEKQDILATLEEKKFRYRKASRKYSSKYGAEEAYTASINFWLFPNFWFFDFTFVLYLFFDDEKISKVQGRVKWNTL